MNVVCTCSVRVRLIADWPLFYNFLRLANEGFYFDAYNETMAAGVSATLLLSLLTALTVVISTVVSLA